MDVIIRVRPDVASILHNREQVTIESEEIFKAAKELGVTVQPIHPGVNDSELRRYFGVEVPTKDVADRVIKRLRQCSAIDAAYVKPMNGLP